MESLQEEMQILNRELKTVKTMQEQSSDQQFQSMTLSTLPMLG